MRKARVLPVPVCLKTRSYETCSMSPPRSNDEVLVLGKGQGQDLSLDFGHLRVAEDILPQCAQQLP